MALLENIKSIAKSVSDAGNHELYQKLQDITREAYELSLENMQLKEEVRTLREKQNNDDIKVYKEGAYYFAEDGPYCTNCYDDLGKKIRMHESDNNMGTIYNVCPKCKTEAKKEEYPYDFPYLDTMTF